MPGSALAAASLAACAVGLLGVDAGLVWVVAGVFTVRSLTGTAPGLAWGIACTGAGLRWGTLGLGDLEVATRLFGPTVIAGTPLVRTGMAAALVAAVVGEARGGGLLGVSWPERGAAVAAVVVLAPAFLVSGPGRITSLIPWAAAAAGLAGVVLLLRPVAGRLPSWLPAGIAVAGVVLSEVAS